MRMTPFDDPPRRKKRGKLRRFLKRHTSKAVRSAMHELFHKREKSEQERGVRGDEDQSPILVPRNPSLAPLGEDDDYSSPFRRGEPVATDPADDDHLGESNSEGNTDEFISNEPVGDLAGGLERVRLAPVEDEQNDAAEEESDQNDEGAGCDEDNESEALETDAGEGVGNDCDDGADVGGAESDEDAGMADGGGAGGDSGGADSGGDGSDGGDAGGSDSGGGADWGGGGADSGGDGSDGGDAGSSDSGGGGAGG